MSRSKQARVRRSAREWKRIVSRFERGGQSSREFCEKEGLALSTLQWWRRKLGGAKTGQARCFVELSDEGRLPEGNAAHERAFGSRGTCGLVLCVFISIP